MHGCIKKRGLTMTTEPEEHLVLESDDGHLYVLHRRVIEEARVPDDRVDDLRDLLSGDVGGYAFASPQFDYLQSRGIIIVGGHSPFNLATFTPGRVRRQWHQHTY